MNDSGINSTFELLLLLQFVSLIEAEIFVSNQTNVKQENVLFGFEQLTLNSKQTHFEKKP